MTLEEGETRGHCVLYIFSSVIYSVWRGEAVNLRPWILTSHDNSYAEMSPIGNLKHVEETAHIHKPCRREDAGWALGAPRSARLAGLSFLGEFALHSSSLEKTSFTTHPQLEPIKWLLHRQIVCMYLNVNCSPEPTQGRRRTTL